MLGRLPSTDENTPTHLLLLLCNKRSVIVSRG